MSIIVWPANLKPSSFRLSLSVNQLAHASPYGGSEQVIDKLNDRWTVSMALPLGVHSSAAAIEAFTNSMRGMGNVVYLYHFARQQIRGTLSGVITAQAAAQGAASVTLSAPTGQTLLAGDMIGAGGLLLQVQSDCVAVGGAIAVPVVNRLRKAIAAGAAVTLYQPTAPFRLMSKDSPQYMPGYAESVTLDFAEAIA